MPACIQLIDKTTKQPVTFVKIDEQLCEHLGAEVHPVKYYRNWYDLICFPLALGQTYLDIRARWNDYADEMVEELKILDWLEERYEPEAWFQRF